VVSGVRWLGDSPGSGFGDAAEEYLSALRGAGVPVCWVPMGHGGWAWGDPNKRAPMEAPEVPGTRHADVVRAEIDHDVLVMHGPPLWHDGWATEEPGTRILACTAWEPDSVPQDRVDLLNRYAGVMVPSRFNRDVLVSSGVRVPVSVVPHIARRLSPGPAPDLPGVTPGTTVFAVIGPWTTRKAMADTLAAYLDAFTADDDVLLVVKTGPEDHIALGAGIDQPTWLSLARLLAGRSNAPRVHLAVQRWPQRDIDALLTRADCLVNLSRGEGWGLTAFDAGIGGTPVVVTGWGGSPEFLPDGYPYLAEYDLVPTDTDPPDDWIEVAPDRRWARVRHDSAVDLLRTVVREPETAAAWGRRLQAHVTAHFSAPQVTPLLLAALAGSAAGAYPRPSG
jgi:glycosyltransferase involved in cell wall biosynthesis